MIGSYILLILFLFFFVEGKSKLVFVIIIISLTNDLFKFDVGFSLSVHYIISLIYVPWLFIRRGFLTREIRKIVSPLIAEAYYLFFLAIIMGFFFPWRSSFDYMRTWSQMSEGRALIQVLRLFSEFSLLFLILYWLVHKYLTIEYVLRVIALTVSFSVVFAIVDTGVDGVLKEFLFSEGRILGDRFTALNVEPRSFGRICSIILLFLIAHGSTKSSTINVGIIFSFVGVLISFSASTYLMTLAWGFVFILITKKLQHLFYVIPFILTISVYLGNFDYFQNDTLRKIDKVLSINKKNYTPFREKASENEPEFFNRFEVFDRAALNFLYEYPLYFFVGTGPNLISIPSSPYLTSSTYDIYGDTIDSVPHSFIVNLIARSGLIGIFLWLLFFARMSTSLNGLDRRKKALFFGLFVSHLIVSTTLFLLIVPVLLYSIQSKRLKNSYLNA